MNDLNSTSGEPEWQKVVDAENNYVERLLGGGFRKEGHGCNSCEAAMINGVYSHEHGCPNTGKIKVDGEWVHPGQDGGLDAEFERIDQSYPGGSQLDSHEEGPWCSSCEAYMNEGTHCHQPGCPNTDKIKVNDAWVDSQPDPYEQEYANEDEFEEQEHRKWFKPGGPSSSLPRAESKAGQIVATMLEDYAGDSEERPGGTRDMWRKGGFKKHGLGAKDFLGKRPGQTDKDISNFSQEEKNLPSGGKMVNPGLERELHKKRRFSWKPPES